MPQIITKGVKRQDVLEISKNLLDDLSIISDTPKDYFTLECVENIYFADAKEFTMYPLIEVILFDRGKEVERKMAQKIQEQVKSLGYSECEVYFTHIQKENYYE